MLTLRCVVLIGCMFASVRAEERKDANLLVNGDFAAGTEAGLPERWSVGQGHKVKLEQHAGMQALRVDITEDGGSSYGQVYQSIPARADTIYRLEGKVKSTKADLAFVSVKLLRDRKEIKRIGSAKSKEQWTEASLEFSSEDADEIQVLCRWEQSAKKGAVGQACWFAQLKLTERGAAPPPPAWTVAIQQAAKVQPVEPPAQPLKATGDLFVTPNGAGRRDGGDWNNALPGNAPGVIQAAWDALAPGQACRIGSGVYVQVALKIATGGSGPEKLKRLTGMDTGQGLPWFIGTWTPSEPDKGPSFLTLVDEVDYCAFENLRTARYQYAAFSRGGRHVGLRMSNIEVYENRHGFFLCGQVNADEADKASHDITIQNCQFIHFTKSAIRLQGGNYDVRIINCLADAGGTDWMKESFQICYSVAGDHPRKLSRPDQSPWADEHDILFINCTARNAIYSKARYWQGDGFLCEGGVRNVAFINCIATDNADGGWDNKASNVVFVNCVSLRNKMNYRVWNHGYFYNCLSASAFKHGGSWTSAGLWTIGDTRAWRTTFHNNDDRNLAAETKNASAGRIMLERCIVSADTAAKTESHYDGQTNVTRTDTIEWMAKDAPDNDPQYRAANGKTWNLEPADAFDSRRFGPGKGYHSATSRAWREKTPEQLVEAAMKLLRHNGWDDFKRQVESLEKN